jgi:NADPH:quinone reductase-like Zn-dependent oxidoreductase
MKRYEIVSPDGIDALVLSESETTSPGPGQVLINIKASCINYRDLMTVKDPGPRGIPYPRVPNSDGAGEVIEVGAGVTRFKAGDRVAGIFMQRWIGGPISADAMASALGGAIDGVLTDYVVLDQAGLVAVPDHMTWEEASTLPCAAVTAWHALVELGMCAGETVLLLGTGGVSIFALQFAVMHGARVIITSSSDEKLARAKKMGAWQTINYRDTPDWEKAVMEMTDGQGVDRVVEVGGAGTLQKSIDAVKFGGTVSLIGVLTLGEINPVHVMRKSVRLQGIYVGNRVMFERMNAAISVHQLRPVIDRTFDFEDARAAYHHMEAAGHFGKIVIRVS